MKLLSRMTTGRSLEGPRTHADGKTKLLIVNIYNLLLVSQPRSATVFSLQR